MTDAQLLRAAHRVTGLSVNKFALKIGRNPRTVKAWRARGDTLTLSDAVCHQLLAITEAEQSRRETARAQGVPSNAPAIFD